MRKNLTFIATGIALVALLFIATAVVAAGNPASCKMVKSDKACAQTCLMECPVPCPDPCPLPCPDDCREKCEVTKTAAAVAPSTEAKTQTCAVVCCEKTKAGSSGDAVQVAVSQPAAK